LKGYVYLVRSENTGLYKIGHAGRPSERLGCLRIKFGDGSLSLVYAGSSEHARGMEAAMHAYYAGKHERGEWYRLSEHEVAWYPSAFQAVRQETRDGKTVLTLEQHAAVFSLQGPVSVRVAAMRDWAGLTQEQLARKSGVGLDAIRKWEHGHRMPRLDRAVRLANALGCTVGQLAGEEPLPRKKEHRP